MTFSTTTKFYDKRKHLCIMEKRKIPTIIWAALTSLSIFCYLYLHSTAVEEYGYDNSVFSISQQESNQEDVNRESKIILPDVVLIKKILNITKIVLPTE